MKNYKKLSIPTRSLKKAEKSGLRALFGVSDDVVMETDEDILQLFQRIDPNLKKRTANVTDPRVINAALETPWLSEDPAKMMMVRGTRAVRATDVGEFLQNFTEVYGLKPDDISKLGKLPKGYGFFEKAVDGTGASTLVTKINR